MPKADSKKTSREKARACKSVACNAFEVKNVNSTKALMRLQSEANKNKGTLQLFVIKFLHMHLFEFSMGMIIMSNIVVMIIELDRAATEGDDPTTAHWTEAFGTAVLIIFAVELALRLFAFRLNFWMDGWNLFDFVLVLTDVTCFFITLLAQRAFPVTVLRVFRVAKLARVTKVLRVFPELKLLLASLFSSMSAIFWGAVLLFLVLLAWSMVAVLFIHPLNKEIQYDTCDRCPRAYSSVMHSALTLWQQVVALDNWGEGTIPLIERYPVTAGFFIPLFLTLGMAVVNLILGMVVSVAQQAKDNFKEIDDAQATAVKLESHSNLLKLCKEMDSDNDGELTQEDLLAGFEEPGEFRDSMEWLGLSKDDFDVIWAMMDTESSGAVDYKRLVSRLYRMKSSQSEFTLAYLKYYITMIRDLVSQLEEDQVEEINLERKVEQGIDRIEKMELKVEEGIARIERKGDRLFERQEKLLEKFQIAVDDAPEREHTCRASKGLAITDEWSEVEVSGMASHGLASRGLAMGQNRPGPIKFKELAPLPEGGLAIGQKISKATNGFDPQIQILLEKLSLVLEKEYQLQGIDRQAVGEERLEDTQGRELQTQEAVSRLLLWMDGWSVSSQVGCEEVKNTLHRLQQTSSASFVGGQSERAANLADQTQGLLAKVSRDIEMMRLELKDMLMNVERKLDSGLPCLSAMESKLDSRASPLPAVEKDIINREAQLDLLVLPEKAESCSLLPRCFCPDTGHH